MTARSLSWMGTYDSKTSGTVPRSRCTSIDGNGGRPGQEARMMLRSIVLAIALAAEATTPVFPQAGAPTDRELVLLATIPKRMSDAAITAFKAHVQQRWGISVTVHTINAGTPIAYGRIVEWAGKPQADVFWGGESSLYDELAEKNLLAKLEISETAWNTIPRSIGKPKPILLKDPERYWIGS